MFLILSFFISLAQAECPKVDLPSEFKLTEQIISMTTKLNLSGDGKDLGYVSEKFFSLTTSFDYYNEKDQLVAKASQAFFSWGTTLDVYDCAGIKIGAIKEEILSSLFSVHTVYTIFNANNETIAKSVKTEFTSTTFEIKSDDELVAKLHRPWIQIRDSWSVSITKPKLDPRLLVMIGAFKTASDNESSKSKSKNKTKH